MSNAVTWQEKMKIYFCIMAEIFETNSRAYIAINLSLHFV
jgi:hypothetical protein